MIPQLGNSKTAFKSRHVYFKILSIQLLCNTAFLYYRWGDRPRLKPYVVSGEQDCLIAKPIYRYKVVFLLSAIQIPIFIVKLWTNKKALRTLPGIYWLITLLVSHSLLSPTFLCKFDSNILMGYYTKKINYLQEEIRRVMTNE